MVEALDMVSWKLLRIASFLDLISHLCESSDCVLTGAKKLSIIFVAKTLAKKFRGKSKNKTKSKNKLIIEE